MNEDSYKLLGLCAAAVEEPVPAICDGAMKNELKTCLEVNEHLQKELDGVLAEGGHKVSEEPTGTEAEVLTRRCYESIIKMGKALARHPEAEESAKDTVRRMIAAKEQLVYHLRPYL